LAVAVVSLFSFEVSEVLLVQAANTIVTASADEIRDRNGFISISF